MKMMSTLDITLPNNVQSGHVFDNICLLKYHI